MASPVTGSIPNLVNGISQQAPALRLPTQAQDQENYYSTIVEGLKDRPPTEHIAKILDTLPTNAFTHIINRDVNEKYLVVFDPADGIIRCFDFQGVERDVYYPRGFGYIAGADATRLRAITVADYTFLVNTAVEVTMDDEIVPTRKPEALVNVLAGNYSKTYAIYINGVLAAQYITPDGDQASEGAYVDTVFIADQLDKSLSANGFNSNGWHSNRYQNAIHIFHELGVNFTIEVQDGYNGNAMKAAKGKIQRFSDLPNFGPDGFVVEVVGDNGNTADNYYVQFQKGSDGPGIWKECVKPGTKLFLHAATMPHALISEADGTFTFDEIEWDPRKAGDTETSPDPSFVGDYIEDVFFHRNRLGFLSGENAIMSRAGSFFDFYRTTATAILDDDPIDVGATHVKVSLLKSAVPYQDQLVLFSEQTQFTVSGQDLLTPKTVSIRPQTEYVCDGAVRPVGLGQSIFFAARRGNFTSLWEYTIDKVSQTASAAEITAHVPAYVPDNVFKMAGTSNENVLALLTTDDPSRVYVYRFYVSSDGTRLQAAWQRWSLPGNPRILNIEFIESDMFVVAAREDGVYLEKIRMQPNAFDDGLGFLVHLDRRVHSDKLPAPVYSATHNYTVYTLPYMPSSDIVAVTSAGGATLPAIELGVAVISTDGRQVALSGDTRNAKLWFGEPFARRYEFSRFFLRTQQPNGSTTAVQSGRLQLRQMTLSHNNSAYFKVEVRNEGRTPYVYEFTGRTLGDANNVLGHIPLKAGKMSIPLLSRSDRVTITLSSDSWMPSAFISAEWSGIHNEKAREL
ncbi:hypothetical protein HL667_06280 [Bradyrhizobium sp. 83012]|uniref:Tail tubular protein B n=1 Tax=Bradyrhizobium aeschynomenes TaxID=2734909 RepID=A0ABX2CBH3_9BRAD|nr:hypothetical protein [Bradyrhizobium aeschynomenes]NPU64599.1 hypothetical protein [Bradyrhizobium aeschynomenes]